MEIKPVQPIKGENPILTFPDSVYGGTGNRVKINKPQYQPENLQSTIYLPEGGRVTVRIIGSEAAASSKIDLLLRQPEQQTLVEYANQNMGFTWTSPGYPPGSNVEFGIYWYWNYYGMIYQGNDAGAIITPMGENEYEIGFEAAGDDWDYNELIINVKIETYELFVIIEPKIISTGQTAQITVKKKFYDGRIEDFPSGQLFEFGVMEGCAAGALVSGEDTAAYFNGVTQPIIFVSADSLENEEDTVKIGVGLIEGTSGEKKMKGSSDYSNMNKQKEKKELADRDPESITTLIIQDNCFGQNFNSTKLGFGDVMVKQDGCDFDSCVDTYDDVQIELLTQPNGFQHAIYQLILENGSVKGAVVDVDTTTVCNLDSANIKNGVVGQSTPVPYSRLRKNTSNNWEKSWILSPCKNDTGAIEYRTITKDSVRTPIYLDFVADVCYDLIAADTSNLTLVNDTTALKNTSIIKDATIALHDICGHRCYPQIVSKDGYIFKEIVYLHELQHRNHYKDIIDSLRSEFLIKPLKETQTKTCEWLNFIKNAENDSSDFENIIYKYTDRATQTYYKISGLSYIDEFGNFHPADTVQELKNERKIHYVQAIKNIVNDYHYALHKAQGTPWPVIACMTCSK